MSLTSFIVPTDRQPFSSIPSPSPESPLSQSVELLSGHRTYRDSHLFAFRVSASSQGIVEPCYGKVVFDRVAIVCLVVCLSDCFWLFSRSPTAHEGCSSSRFSQVLFPDCTVVGLTIVTV